ncbi:RNA methyltransferase, TrmH family [Lachnospiraceae bacterium]|nr:RNA methyltransferase, TrmH family [Lachnospiraceae bacterium]
MDILTSPNNEKVKLVAKLLSSPKERKYSGKYVVEGMRMVEEIPDNLLGEMYFTQDYYDKKVVNNEKLLRLVNIAAAKNKCYIVTEPVLRRITDTETPQGILATVMIKEKTVDDLLGDGTENPLILIIERLQDPGNMGTIIRSAEGAGVTGILVSYDSVDIYSPKVIRSTMGSIFRKNVAVTYDLFGDINRLRSNGIVIYGMHLSGSSMYETDLTGPVAFLIGNEGRGLTENISAAADKLIRIPMKGSLESLNAASSATVISYEAMRQRENRVSIDIAEMF